MGWPHYIVDSSGIKITGIDINSVDGPGNIIIDMFQTVSTGDP